MSHSLSRIPHADDMDDALFENTEGAEVWKNAARAIGENFTRFGAALQSLPVYDDAEDDAVTTLRDDLQELVQSYGERLDNEGWENAGKYYIFGQIDTATLVAAARQEMMDWDDVLYAKALMGTGGDIKTILEAMQNAEAGIDLDEALRWAAEPGELTDGLHHSGNLDTSTALLAAGAKPSSNDGDLFFDVLREGREDIARAFCRAGRDDESFHLHYWNENARSWLNEAAPRDLLRQMYWEYDRYEAVDAATLLERKPMRDGGSLRIIFDFAARRVSEIYMREQHAFKTEVSFDDYGAAALDTARSKLRELGGHPPEDVPGPSRSLGKPKLAAPSR